MAETKDKSVDQSIDQTTQPVAAKSGELSDAELQKAAGGGASGSPFDIEQTANIGSQSSGAGAGKVTFNPFEITR